MSMLKSKFWSGCGSALLTLALAGFAFAQDYTENPGTEGNGNFTIGPNYEPAPELQDQGNPKGKSFQFTMALADSKIFRGDDETLEPTKGLRKARNIYVYVPAQYKDGTKAPFLVIHDGPGQLRAVSNALDNLTISTDPNRRLPAFIAIAVQNGGDDSKGSQRGLEYDTMSDREARFINDEVLPAVLKNKEIRAAYPNIAFTDNPWGRGVMGGSSGGSAALIMGWFRPDLFRRIITYSGTFVDQQDDDAPEEATYPLGAWEYHDSLELIQNAEKKNLRIFLHVSENDLGWDATQDWYTANFNTADDLAAKGYHYRFLYAKNASHCDDKVFNETVAETLLWTWRGYPTD
jgi:enterochelin esterase-like enzyme